MSKQGKKFSQKVFFTIFLLFVIAFGTCKCSIHRSLKVDKNTPIAVWTLDDLSPGAKFRPDLGELLSDHVVDVISQNGFKVVERKRLIEILEELKIGSSELSDPNTRLRLGRLAGARFMVFGAYQSISGKVRFDLRLVDVETSKIVKAVKKIVSTDSVDMWLKAVDDAALELLKVSNKS